MCQLFNQKRSIYNKNDWIWTKLLIFIVVFNINRRFRSNLTYFWYKLTYFRCKSTVFDWIIDTRSILIDLLIDFILKKINLIKNRSILDRIISKIDLVDSTESTIIRLSNSDRDFDSKLSIRFADPNRISLLWAWSRVFGIYLLILCMNYNLPPG